MSSRLVEHADAIHASEMAAQRLRTNLSLIRMDPVEWVKDAVRNPDSRISLQGRKWQVSLGNATIIIRDGTFAIENGILQKEQSISVEPLEIPFAICKLPDFSGISVPEPFFFTACTDTECSLICPWDRLPENSLEHSGPWRCFRVAQPMNLELVDHFAGLTRLLVSNRIGVFSASTFLTEYVFVPDSQWDQADSPESPVSGKSGSAGSLRHTAGRSGQRKELRSFSREAEYRSSFERRKSGGGDNGMGGCSTAGFPYLVFGFGGTAAADWSSFTNSLAAVSRLAMFCSSLGTTILVALPSASFS